MEKKVCSRCREEKNITTEFTTKGFYKTTGKQKYDSICKTCYAKRQDNRRKTRRQNGFCSDCGLVISTKYRCPACQAVHVIKVRERSQRQKERIIEVFNNRCHLCGESFEVPSIYEFHHPNEKNISVSRILRWSFSKILSEARNCIMVCANCHQKIHVELDDKKERNDQAFKERNRRRELKAEAIAYLGGKCIICGLADGISEVYEFHHKLPETKEFTMAWLITHTKTLSDLTRELDKCDLVCGNCHRVVHWKSSVSSGEIEYAVGQN